MSLSWGVYLGASLGILALLLPYTNMVGSESQYLEERSAVRGVASVLNSMEPGMVVDLGYSMPPAQLALTGHILTMSVGNVSVTEATRWKLPDTTLSPNHLYQLSLASGELVVKETG